MDQATISYFIEDATSGAAPLARRVSLSTVGCLVSQPAPPYIRLAVSGPWPERPWEGAGGEVVAGGRGEVEGVGEPDEQVRAVAGDPGVDGELVLVDQAPADDVGGERGTSEAERASWSALQLAHRLAHVSAQQLGVPVDTLERRRRHVLRDLVDGPREGLHPVGERVGGGRTPGLLHQLVGDPPQQQTVGPRESLRGELVDVGVQLALAVIEAAVEGDVDQVGQGAHAAM